MSLAGSIYPRVSYHDDSVQGASYVFLAVTLEYTTLCPLSCLSGVPGAG